jgi:hypothetical protein
MDRYENVFIGYEEQKGIIRFLKTLEDSIVDNLYMAVFSDGILNLSWWSQFNPRALVDSSYLEVEGHIKWKVKHDIIISNKIRIIKKDNRYYFSLKDYVDVYDLPINKVWRYMYINIWENTYDVIIMPLMDVFINRNQLPRFNKLLSNKFPDCRIIDDVTLLVDECEQIFTEHFSMKSKACLRAVEILEISY